MSQQSKYDVVARITGVGSVAVVLANLTATDAIRAKAVVENSVGFSAASPTGTVYLSKSNAARAGMSDLLNSTAIYALLRLELLAKDYPNLTANIDDARSFARAMPFDLPRPNIWTDKETEVAFEWKNNSRHAMVSFEGNQSFGYALRRGNRFVPGAFPGDLTAGVPRDLLNYLRDNANT